MDLFIIETISSHFLDVFLILQVRCLSLTEGGSLNCIMKKYKVFLNSLFILNINNCLEAGRKFQKCYDSLNTDFSPYLIKTIKNFPNFIFYILFF